MSARARKIERMTRRRFSRKRRNARTRTDDGRIYQASADTQTTISLTQSRPARKDHFYDLIWVKKIFIHRVFSKIINLNLHFAFFFPLDEKFRSPHSPSKDRTKFTSSGLIVSLIIFVIELMKYHSRNNTVKAPEFSSCSFFSSVILSSHNCLSRFLSAVLASDAAIAAFFLASNSW